MRAAAAIVGMTFECGIAACGSDKMAAYTDDECGLLSDCWGHMDSPIRCFYIIDFTILDVYELHISMREVIRPLGERILPKSLVRRQCIVRTALMSGLV